MICVISYMYICVVHRSVYSEECLGPGNLKMVQLARQVNCLLQILPRTSIAPYDFFTCVCVCVC